MNSLNKVIKTLSLHDALPISNKEDIADIVEEETEVTEENLSVGDTVEMEGVTITINDAYYTDERNEFAEIEADRDRKSTRLNSSHVAISYAVFCLKKKNKNIE